MTEDNPNANDLRQSHELEMQMGINDWVLIQVTAGTLDQPLGENVNFNTVEIEGEFSFIRREGDGIGLAFQGGYEQPINNAAPRGRRAECLGVWSHRRTGQGPVIADPQSAVHEPGRANLPRREGLGFEYGWRGKYSLNSHWGVGVEMFGEIEDLANAGSFNSQNHSIGPTLFYTFGGDENGKGDDEAKAKGGDDDEKAGKAPETEFSMNVGFQFGLTDATSDGALKFQGSLQF